MDLASEGTRGCVLTPSRSRTRSLRRCRRPLGSPCPRTTLREAASTADESASVSVSDSWRHAAPDRRSSPACWRRRSSHDL